MSVNDPISDMLTRIRNAGMAQKPDTTMPATKILIAIADILKKEGYIRNYTVMTSAKSAQHQAELWWISVTFVNSSASANLDCVCTGKDKLPREEWPRHYH